MKRYFTLSVLLCAVVAALACGGYVRPHYYIFSVYQRNQMGYTFIERMDRFWQDYTGDQNVTTQSLNWVSPDEFDNTSNPIVSTARQRGDSEMTAYLRLLVEYLSAAAQCDPEAWEYPTKQQLAKKNATMVSIHDRAVQYGGQRLRGQYNLLAMRSIMAQADNEQLIDFWQRTGQKAPEGVYKDMMRDIYAGALLRTGKKKEACDIYAELGDMLSIMWVMRDKRNLAGIRDEFAQNPNSPTLTYLVQDYVNNFDWSTEQASKEWSNVDLRPVIADAEQFVAFARQAAKNPAVKNPVLWQSAAGYATLQMGRTAEAKQMLLDASKMKGTPRMLDNNRVCLMLTNIADDRSHGDDYFNRLAPDFRWLIQQTRTEPVDINCYFCNSVNHYMEVLSNVVYDELSPRLQRWDKAPMAIAMLAWFSNDAFKNPADASANDYSGVTSEACSNLAYAIDSLSSRQLEAYSRYLTSRPSNELERMFLTNAAANSQISGDDYNDLMGTKLLREGSFAEAIPFLRRVPLSHISDQGISRYMAARDYHRERWFGRQVVDRDDVWDFEKATVTENQKVQFCEDVLRLRREVDNADNPYDKGWAQYRLATILFQASVDGDCWYLPRYAHSVYDEVCYPKEYDFTAATVKLLDEAYANATVAGDFDLQQRALYANAFVPYGEPYITYDYDEDYNRIEKRNPNTHEYRSLMQLSRFYRSNRADVAPYMSRCLVLRQFMAKN